MGTGWQIWVVTDRRFTQSASKVCRETWLLALYLWIPAPMFWVVFFFQEAKNDQFKLLFLLWAKNSSGAPNAHMVTKWYFDTLKVFHFTFSYTLVEHIIKTTNRWHEWLCKTNLSFQVSVLCAINPFMVTVLLRGIYDPAHTMRLNQTGKWTFSGQIS